MSFPRPRHGLLPVAVALTLLLFSPQPADAQRRGPHRAPAVRSVVIIGGIGYSRYLYDDPWQYPWGPYRGYPLSYRYPVFDELTSSIRLEVTPKDAQVFVDGYAAGEVDDFDGMFQRLRLTPGAHDIAIYHEKFRTVIEHRYLNPGAESRLKFAMEPLGPGETAEPPPPPSGRRERSEAGEAGVAARDHAAEAVAARERAEEAPARFGTLVLRVQPADADIFVDGERWSGAMDRDRVRIELPVGRHHVEVGKDGLSRYVEDVLIQPGRTLTLNVSLK